MSSRHRGLGRGLSALIPGAEAVSGLIEAKVADIAPNPRQPRHDPDAEALQELASSIREHGLLQPLIVTETNAVGLQPSPRYQIIAGERRWRAAQLAGLETVPVLIREATPQDSLELALVENIQRADLGALEEANAYEQLVNEFGLTQEQVAQRVGRSRVSVTNSLRLLHLQAEIKEALQAGGITEGHARALLGLDDERLQLRVLQAIKKQALSVRQTEELVRRLAAGEGAERPAAHAQTPETRALEDRFRESLGTQVRLFRSRRGGRVVIHFYSEEELQAIFERIVGEGL
jgi:ParB family chromosome partitioning protein